MSVPVPKLAILGFLKPQYDSSLDALGALLGFMLLCQLERMMEIQIRDLTLASAEKNGLDPRDGRTPMNEQLRKVAQMNRVRYVCGGQLSYALQEDGRTGFKVNFWLYDAEHHHQVINDTLLLPREEMSAVHDTHLPAVSMDKLNQAINQMMQLVWASMAQVGTQGMVEPLSNSLIAVHHWMRAHHALRHEEKIAFYDAALREDIQLEMVHAQLARIYKNEQSYEKSVLCFREALRYAHGTPRNKALYATEAGIACALLRRPELALQWWIRAIEYDPAYLNPYFNVANIYEDQNNLIEAEKYFLKAQQLAPQDFRTYLSLGRIYSKLGEWEKALSQYQRQLETESDDPWCHSDVATCYLNLGDIPNAKLHLQKTVTLDPDGEAGQYAQLILGGMSLN